MKKYYQTEIPAKQQRAGHLIGLLAKLRSRFCGFGWKLLMREMIFSDVNGDFSDVKPLFSDVIIFFSDVNPKKSD